MAGENEIPPPFIAVRAAGSMIADVPAHLIGDRGGAYKYGNTLVGGVKNMMSNGEMLRSIVADRTQIKVPSLLQHSMILGGLGTGTYDEISNTKHVQLVVDGRVWADTAAEIPQFALLNVNGEFCFQETTAASGHYGGAKEQFASPGTVTVAAASDAVVGAGTAFLVDTLNGYGAYTPNFNFPRAGDLIEIIQGGNSFFHRVKSILDATHLAIYPAWNGSNGGGLTYKLWRTGYGSFSRTIIFYNSAGSWLYYCGNVQLNEMYADTMGTIMAVTSAGNHKMSPELSPSGNPLYAVDIAYFRNFLLYGAGNAIGWSTELAPFPSDPTAGFDVNDFPDENINAGFTDDTFVAFEYLGDQVVALFRKSAYLAQATGVVPAFEFHRMPQYPGIYNKGDENHQLVTITGNRKTFEYTRPCTHSGSSIYFVSTQGIMEMRGAPPAGQISTPIDSYEWPSPDNTFDLTYDPSSDTVLVMDGHAVGLGYRRGDWFELDLRDQGEVRGVAAGIDTIGAPIERYGPVAIGYWDPSTKNFYIVSADMEKETSAAANGSSYSNWKWPSPVIDFGSIYKGIHFGGFEIVGRPPAALVAPVNLTWALWGGQNPFEMAQLRTGTFDYKTGHRGARTRIGGTTDLPFIGIVLSGSFFIDLWGVRVYPIDTEASR